MENDFGKTFNIEENFLNGLLFSNKSKFLKAVKEIPDSFFSKKYVPIYSFIKNYYKQNKRLPSKEILLVKFPHFIIQKPKDTLAFYTQEFSDYQDYKILTLASSEMQNALLGKDLEKSKEVAKNLVLQLAKVRSNEDYSLLKNYSNRVKQYLEAKRNDGVIGLQTPIERLNKHIGGIQDEVFIIMGRRGLGKTFMGLFVMKEFAYQLDQPVAVVSNEMSVSKVGMRMDALFAEVNYSRYRKGLCTKEEEEKLKNLKNVYKKIAPVHIISGVNKSAEEIGYELLALDVGAYMIDGLYLQKQGFRDSFENTLHASRAYQRITKELSVPAIITTQINKNEEAKYAGAIEEDADMVVKMFRSPAMKDDGTMGFKFTKIREEDDDFSFYLNWSFDPYNFSERRYDVADEEEEMGLE